MSWPGGAGGACILHARKPVASGMLWTTDTLYSLDAL